MPTVSRDTKFEEVLAKARPAIGLNRHRPRDLLSTPDEAGLVEDFLERLAYGVYV